MDPKTTQALNDLIEQRLDAQQAQRLSELLESQPAACEAYLKMLGIHLDLAETVAPVRQFSLEELRAMRAIDATFGDSLLDQPSPPHMGGPRTGVRGQTGRGSGSGGLGSWRFVFALAAAVLLAVVLTTNWRGSDPPPVAEAPPAPMNQAAADGIVARITKKIDCDWEEDRWSVSTSADITAGQRINLSRGLLVLEFTSGAQITLNGPATLIPISPLSAQLLEGTLSANVPPSGRGFTIETHAGQFVDLGTEFGMIVSDDGAVETHVFKGKVVAEPVVPGVGRTESVTLETGAAWSRTGAATDDSLSKAEPDRFMRPIISGEQERSEGPPVSRELSLWFDASRRVQLDENGRVSAWGDATTDANHRAEDAWQVIAAKRPDYNQRAINGRPALRFDGYRSLVTEPLTLGADQTSAVVFRVDGEAASRLVRGRNEYRHLGVQLLNLNGPPHTVMQINADVRLEARVHFAWLQNTPDPQDAGLLRSGAPVDGNAHVALYTYSGSTSVARLYLDGALISESTDAPAVDSTTSPRYLGSHYGRTGFGFTGDIAEILVYDTAFTHDEAADLSAWITAKYDIPVPELPAEPAGDDTQE